MGALRFHFHALLLLSLARASIAAAQEPPNAEACIAELRSHSDRLPRFSAEWKVVRFDAADKEEVKAMALQFDEQIQAAATDLEKKQLKHEKSLKVARASQGEVIPFTVKLDYFHDDRFYMAVNAASPNASVSDAEYYLNGDGVVYRVNGKSVRVMPLVKATREFLRGLLSSLPEFVVNRDVGGIQTWKTLRQDKTSFQIGGVNGLRGVQFTLDSITHRLMIYEIGDISPRFDGVVFTELDRMVSYGPFREDLGYPVPKETIVRFFSGRSESAREDRWTPVRFQVQPDISQMHSPQYEFQPGYKVVDETGEKPREYLSDEVLKKEQGGALQH